MNIAVFWAGSNPVTPIDVFWPETRAFIENATVSGCFYALIF